jgi:hypothetical protein
VEQVKKELHIASLHLREANEAMISLAGAGWHRGDAVQMKAWENARERQMVLWTRVEELEAELMRHMR